MAYIPSNKIKTNQYTPGGRYTIEGTNEDYVGYYYELYTGEKYTGKTQNDPPNRLLVDTDSSEDEIYAASNTNNAYSFLANTDDFAPFPNQSVLGMQDISDYLFSSELQEGIRFIPQITYREPTKEDYDLGVFTRYFCVKRNEIQWVEVNKEVYDSIFNKDDKWEWRLYQSIKLQWTLEGKEDYVSNTNRNSVLLAEKFFKTKGLREFLREDYLKFYAPKELMNVKKSNNSFSAKRRPTKPKRNTYN